MQSRIDTAPYADDAYGYGGQNTQNVFDENEYVYAAILGATVLRFCLSLRHNKIHQIRAELVEMF